MNTTPVRHASRGFLALLLSAVLAALSGQLSAATSIDGLVEDATNPAYPTIVTPDTYTVTGTVRSTAANGYGIGVGLGAASSQITVNNGALVEGAGGITIAELNITVRNSGRIIGSNISGGYSGIFSNFNALIDNTAGGVIQSANRAVYIAGGGTILNAGKITSTGSVGILATNNDTSITNASNGVINGVNTGVHLVAGGNITNSGTISGGSLGVSSSNNATLVSNTNSGVITAADRGVYLVNGGTVINSGTIIGTDSYGIDVGSLGASLIENAENGLVRGALNGTVIGSGTLNNSGTIIGLANDGVWIATGAGVLLNNSESGLIDGGATGVISQGSGTVMNSGTIKGANIGVDSNAATLVSNTGVITGGTGVRLAQGGTVANAGTITGTGIGGIGVYSNNAATLVSNTTGGVITGGTAGVFLDVGGTVQNSGTIQGKYGVYSYSYDAKTLVSNTTGGVITGDTIGVLLNFGGTVTNSGTISGVDAGVFSGANATLVSNTTGGVIQGIHGVDLNAGGTLVNSGTISGVYAGVFSDANATLVSNTTSGVITGDTFAVGLNRGGTVANSGTIRGSGHGISLANDSGLIVNSGLVEGTSEDAVELCAGGTVQNTGTIQGRYGVYAYASASPVVVENAAGALIKATGNYDEAAVYLGAGGLVDNAGELQGVASGVFLAGGGTVANSGTISGATNYAVRVNAGTALVSNTAGATIENGIYAGGVTTVDNRGLVTGDLGVYVGASSTLVNTGTIDVTGTAVTFAGHTDYTNNSLIRGGDEGVHFESTGSLGNTGTIIGTNGIGVVGDDNIVVTNAAAGLIQGGTHGVYLATGGTVINSGTIVGGDTGYGVYVADGLGYVEHQDGALIDGGIYAGGTTHVHLDGVLTGTQGVWLSVDSYITGTAAITVTGTALILDPGSNQSVLPDQYRQGSLVGASLMGTGSLGNSGTLIGVADAGVEAKNGSVYIANMDIGYIEGGTYGINLTQGGTVLNSGTILGTLANDGSVGVYSNGLTDITNTGYIEGHSRGVSLDTGAVGSTITNTGTIRAILGSDGVVSDSSILVTNTAGGLIDASNFGVWLKGGGTVANHGLITAGVSGIQLDAGDEVINTGVISGTTGAGITSGGATVLVTNSGLIESDNIGVQLAGGTVSNTGTISGDSDAGVAVTVGTAFVDNQAGALITGNDGVKFETGGTVTNSGTILGTADAGISSGGPDTLITNKEDALVQGDTTGISLSLGGTVANTGTIRGNAPGSTGVYAAGSEVVIGNNATTGVITGGYAGVHIAGDGTVNNTGTIAGTDAGSYGVYADGGAVTINNKLHAVIEGAGVGAWLNGGDVTNYGLIQGGDAGVQLNGGTVTNDGTISGTAVNSVGVDADAGMITVINHAGGLIQGDMHGINTAAASDLTLTNSGTILGTGENGSPAATGVYSEGRADITNYGLIQGGETGVNLGGMSAFGSIVRNSGTIRTAAAPNGTAIYITQNEAEIDNLANGLIEGGEYGIKVENFPALVTNRLGGIIRADNQAAIYFSGGGSVANAGEIWGGQTGIQSINQSAYVTNAAGGLIYGNDRGVWLQSGTVINAGEITAANSAVRIDDSEAYVENNPAGHITGGIGVELMQGGSVANSGTITGDDQGVYVDAGVVVVENTGGQISGGINGVWMGGGGRVRNTGTITGAASYGIYSGVGVDVEVENNTTGGYIYGDLTGVHVAGTGTITNNGGYIEGGNTGVWLGADGTVTNSGTIIGLNNGGNGDGVHFDNASGLVINSGLIESMGDDAVQLSRGGTVQNTGTLRGYYGIYGVEGSALVDNASSALISAESYGVWLKAGGTVTNAGTIESIKKFGIHAEDQEAVVENTITGLISGGTIGVQLSAGGTVTNSGTIIGTGSAGIYSNGQTVVTNTTGGVITGPTYAINLEADAANIVNLWNSSTLAGNLQIVGAASLLTLNGDAGTTQLYADAVTGDTTFSGTLIKQGAGTWTIDQDPGAGMAQNATLVEAGKLIVEWAEHQLNDAAVNIATDAILEVRTADTTGTTTLVNPLTGDGLLDLIGTATVDSPNVTFALDAAMGPAFSGTVGVGSAYGHKTIFDLATSETALTSAVLKLNALSETTLDANRAIGGLDLAGGTFIVKSGTVGGELIPYKLTVETLAVSESGGLAASKIGVDTEVLSGINPPIPPGDGLNGSIFDVDVLPPDFELNKRTIVESTGSGPADGIAFDLVDSYGNTLASGTDNTLITFRNKDGIADVGVNTYGYNAVTQDGNIVLNHGLISIESTNSAEAVIIDSTGSLDKTLSAKLTGTTGGAGFTFVGGETITLAHTGNNYTGTTFITDNTTIWGGASNVIASSTSVIIDAGATFDLGDYNQTLQNVFGAGDIQLRDKTLTVISTETGVEFSGVIDDNGLAGNVTLADNSEWTLLGNNTYTGTTTIGAGAQLQLGNGGATGMIDDDSAVANSGTFTINRSDDLIYGGTVTGDGVFIQRGVNETVLTGANKIDGGLVVENGALVIGQNDTTGWYSSTIAANARVDESAALIFNRSDEVIYDGVISGSGNVATVGSGVLAIQKVQAYEGVTLVGPGSTLRTDIANAISPSAGVILFNGTLDLNNNNQLIKNLLGIDGEILYSTDRGAATTYTTLTISGELDGITHNAMNVDLLGQKSDKLTVQGLASGTHFVYLNPTTDPTLLLDPQRKYSLEMIKLGAGSDAEIVTAQPIESGMHTYELHKGDGGLIMPNSNSYYLSGGNALSRAADAILFTAGVMGTDWHYELDSVYKRMGDIRGNIGRDTGSVWARANTYRLNARSKLGGSTFEQDTYGLTAGVDKVFAMDGGYEVAVGGFIGMTRSDRTFEDSRNDYGDGSSNSISIGAYALLLFDNGVYVDATLKLDRYSNDLKARGVDGHVSRGDYSNNVQGLSVEVGRRVNLLQTATSESSKLAGITVWAEPSAQVAAGWINGSDYTVSNGVSRDLKVHIGDSDAWQYRLQIRTGANIGRWMPYIKLAGVKNDTSDGEVVVEGRKYSPDYDGWRFETGVGAGFMIDPQSAVYLDYEYNKASAYERPWSVNFGYRRTW